MQMISIFFTLLNLSHFTNYQRKKCHLSSLDFFRVKPLVPGAPPPSAGPPLVPGAPPLPSAGQPLLPGAPPPQRVHP